MNHELQTKRLRLTQMTEADKKDFASLLGHDEVIRYCFDPLPPEAIQASFESRLAQWTVNSEHWLCLSMYECSTGHYVGTNGFRVSDSEKTVEVGFLLLPEHHGKGYATESLEAVLAYARQLGFVKSVAYVTEGNAASCRVLEKRGFKLSRIDSNAVSINNKMHNDLVFEAELA